MECFYVDECGTCETTFYEFVLLPFGMSLDGPDVDHLQRTLKMVYLVTI